jgi:ABC-type Na+ transport system ATPase subunit NatA
MKRQFSLLMGQKNALWWDLPAQESLELNRAIYGIDRARFQKVVGGLSELLDVQDKMNVMVRELSLGERMKMELISALIHEPRVLFLDEPTIGLDVVSQKRVREFLRVYNREHRIVTMLTSHYMQDIEELCHRVIIIDHGRIFFDGPLDSIIDRFATHKILDLTFAAETACTFGTHDSVALSAQWLGMLVSRSVSPLAIGPPTAANLLPPGRFRQFRLDSFVSDLNEADLAVLQHPNDALGNRKDNNRLIMAMSLGMPVITSQTQAYVETLKDVGFPELACSSSDDFLKLFDELAIRERRHEVGSTFYEYAWENYSPGRIVNLFTQAISDAFR